MDEDGVPVANVALELCKSETEVLRHKTGPHGTARFDRLEDGSYQLALCDLDQDVWELAETEALTPQAAKSAWNAAWVAPGASDAGAEIVHEVVQGECTLMLADRFGHLPETVWEYAANDALHGKGKSMPILLPGDTLVIPPRRIAAVDVTVKHRYRIVRKRARTNFSVRFLGPLGLPYKGCQYLIGFYAGPDTALGHRLGKTDDEGFLREFILPKVTSIEVDLKTDVGDQVYQFDVGALDPVKEMSGVVARLNNLGFPCTAGDPDAIACAVATFQWCQQIDITGELDDDTRTRIAAAHLS